MTFFHLATWNEFTFGVHKSFEYCTFYYIIYKRNHPLEVSFLDLTIYIKGSTLNTRLYSKTTDRHMYLNFSSEHPMSLKKNQYHTHNSSDLKRIHTEYLLEAQIHMYFFFIWREYPHAAILKAWMKTNKITREQLLTPAESIQDADVPLIFITTYSRANPNFKELFSKHWSYLGRSSATRE